MAQEQKIIQLPKITMSGEQNLPQLLQQRRSTRNFQDVPLSPSDIGQLLWAAQGITNSRGYRTAPSAGALFPLEMYVVAGQVKGISSGIYHYDPNKHKLIMVDSGDRRKKLAQAAWGKTSVSDAATVVVFAAVYQRTTFKYGERGVRYVHMEIGHAAQNLHLQAESLGLGTVVVGAFDDDEVKAVLQLPDDVQPLMLMPVGKKSRK